MHKSIKKIVPYFLILIILVGLFSPMVRVNAQATPTSATPTTTTTPAPAATLGTCTGGNSLTTNAADCTSSGGTWQVQAASNNVLEANLKNCSKLLEGDFDGCVEKIAFYLFYGIPAFLLGFSAQFFNALISATLSSTLYNDANSFITGAWTVVRDFSNIFFILILLYVAIQTILGLGHETKKIIVHVIIMALLINFSMFFTKVVIDSSNVLALIFYNRINVDMQATGNTDHRFYIPFMDSSKTGIEEKDVSGGLVNAFDPSRMLSQDFFDKYKNETQAVGSKLGLAAYVGGGAAAGALIAPLAPITATGGAIIGGVAYGVKSVYGYFLPTKEVPTVMILAIILISGLIMSFAAYAFFVTGVSFLARLIELWILIIFAPFAFMSWSIPRLANVTYLGWEAWLKRLLEVSFMAPVFMFLLYIIFMFVNAKIFNNLQNEQGALQAIFMIVLPALVILILLLKATKWAKEKSGELGTMLMTGAKIAGGAALVAATGGTALALRAGVGAVAAKAGSSETLQKGAKKTGVAGIASRMALRTVDYGSKASFDVRGIKVAGKSLASTTGLNIGTAQEGGYVKMRADTVKKHQERAKQLEVREDEGLKQNLNALQTEQQGLLKAASHEIGELDKQIKSATEASNAAAAALRAETPGTGAHTTAQTTARNAAAKVIDLRRQKSDIKNATGADVPLLTAEAATAKARATAAPTDIGLQNAARAAKAALDVATISAAGSGRSINELGDRYIPDALDAIEKENRERKWAYAERQEGKGDRIHRMMLWRKTRTNREASHNIRMETKLDSGKKEE